MGDMYWNGDDYLDSLESEYDGRTAVAAEVVAAKMRDNLNIDYPPPSQVGDSPHRRSGRLQGDIVVEKKDVCLYWVHARAPYSVFLELGTSKMGKRPFMLKSLMETSQQVYQIIIEGDQGTPGIRPFAPSFAFGFMPHYAPLLRMPQIVMAAGG